MPIRIIVVDDYLAMRSMVINILKTLGFTDISQAKNGKDAWDKLIASHDVEKKIELAFVDWNMPIISGIDLLKKIKQDSRMSGVTFIMLTAEGAQENILHAIKDGVDDYIIKPFKSILIQEKLLSVAAKKYRETDKEVDDFFSEFNLAVSSEAESNRFFEEFRQKVLKVNQYIPWSCIAPYQIGKLYFKFKKYQKAEEYLRKSIAINFGMADAHKLLSKILKSTGKVAESIDELKIAVTERPRSAHLRQKLGNAYMRAGIYDLAIKELSTSLSLTEKTETNLLATSKNQLGKAKLSKGEETGDETLKKNGVEDIQAAVKLKPDFISAQYDLLVAYKKTNQPEAAMAVLKVLQSAEPKDAPGWVSLGKMYLDQTELNKTIFSFKKADTLANGVFEIYQEMATALTNNQYIDEAIPFIDKAIECNPADVWSYNMKGIIYRKKGDFQKAIVEYKKASEIDPNDANIFYNIGVACCSVGEKNKSEEYFKKAIALDPRLTNNIEAFKSKK